MLTSFAKASCATRGLAGLYLEIPANPTNLKLLPGDPPAGC
jgi:hypothetical protein